MALPQIEAFVRRLMTDPEWTARFRTDPETALADTDLDAAERWAAIESLRDGDDDGTEFLGLFRTRLALVGIEIGAPPPGLRVFAPAPGEA